MNRRICRQKKHAAARALRGRLALPRLFFLLALAAAGEAAQIASRQVLHLLHQVAGAAALRSRTPIRARGRPAFSGLLTCAEKLVENGPGVEHLRISVGGRPRRT